MAEGRIKEISVFVDESGSYDADVSSSPYYLVCLVLHDQSADLANDLEKLNELIARTNTTAGGCVHTSPLIRRENEYANELREVRRKLFYAMLSFVRKVDIGYRCFRVDKAFIDREASIHAKLCGDISAFLIGRGAELSSYDKIKVYYDNGQSQIKKVLVDAFSMFASKTEFVPEVTPEKYRLFQAADMICTLEHIKVRIDEGVGMNNSEKAFFGSARLFKRNVFSQIASKEL